MRTRSIRTVTEQHLPEVFSLYRTHLARTPDEPRIAQHIARFPSAVLLVDGHVEGFAYSTEFAPDVLELANIFVAPTHRNGGHGADLLTYVEDATRKDFSAIIVVNSVLYPSAGHTRPATDFYLRLGYDLIADTRHTGIFFKRL